MVYRRSADLPGRAIEELTTYLQHWANPATRGQASFAQFDRTIIIYILLYFGDASTILFASLILARVASFSTGTMRVGLFRKMQRMQVQYFDQHSDGDILARYTSDLDNIFNAMNQALLELFLAIAQFVGILLMMFNQNVQLAWVTMASTPVALVIAAG